MKIAIVSDTHLPRFRARLAYALEMVAREEPQLILHCGDLTEFEAVDAFAAIAPVDAVAGNNDGDAIEQRFGRKKIVEVDGFRIGMIHGDGARGTTEGRARAAFAGESVDAIAFGHSHQPLLERHGHVWLVNPGSITDKRREAQFSFAILESVARGRLEPRLVFFSIASA